MGSKGKVFVPDATDTPNIGTVALAQATSIFTRIVTSYATETERNTETTSTPTGVGVKMTDAQKAGMVCWVAERSGWCGWDGGEWRWLGSKKLVAQATRPGSAETNTVTPLLVLSTGSFNLPPGNRLLEIVATSRVDALLAGAGWAPRTWLQGAAIGVSWMGQRTLTSGNHDVFTRTWWRVTSGAQSFELYGLNAAGNGALSWNNTEISVVDHGPA